VDWAKRIAAKWPGAARRSWCVADDFSSAQPSDGDDYVMYIRYLDAYVRERNCGWLISRRDVVTDAVEHRDVTAGGP